MQPKDYPEFVQKLCKPGHEIVEGMSGSQAHLLHMVVGVAGEAGELLDAVKKHVIYGKTLDMANVVEELGDLEFYMQGIRNAISVSRESVLHANFNKLGQRYRDKVYTDREAVARADKA
jgi:NTP pyrophosphatase (non-canonical NTP hydrolase)